MGNHGNPAPLLARITDVVYTESMGIIGFLAVVALIWMSWADFFKKEATRQEWQRNLDELRFHVDMWAEIDRKEKEGERLWEEEERASGFSDLD